MQDTDEQLMLAYAGGDMKAFEMLYQRHRGPLYRYVLRYCGDSTLANDLYQGSWEKVIKGRKRYRANAPFKAWMYRVAHNHIVDHFRRHSPTGGLDPDLLETNTASPDTHLSTQQRRQELMTAIDQLPHEQKETVLLRLEAGLDLNSIAEVTGVNAETAKSRLRYAVQKLKQTMEANAVVAP